VDAILVLEDFPFVRSTFNAQRYYEQKQIMFQTGHYQENKIWNIAELNFYMPLEKNMDVTKIVIYLADDLKKSAINDVKPCLNLNHEEGGYFGIPRLVLSYVDYLGALYNGYDGKIDKKTGRRIFAAVKYAKSFLNNIFGQIDPNYIKYGALLWEIYRNGTIHLYSPKILKDKNSNRAISWIAHKLDRTTQLGPPFKFQAEPYFHYL